ncbi:aminotransferase A [Caloramator proteoclasticus]|uniref:Aminotransferase n=1 Tax=Caloramator proteoclasticus DSM 10124 TaxID=1121262 RepID=A0A1M4Z5H7_9CLOT|nr:aminotransferase A [Caloramator proteoclasticus]SHF13304.1 aminotransferase [Caloramator proteoclasticus DSM 10124]
MENLLNKDVRSIEISGIRKFYNMVSKYDNVISLTIGQPDFNTPNHIKEAAKLALENNKTIYTHNAGIIELRRAISNFVQKKYNLYYNPDDEIIVTCGASEGIFIALKTILDIGDEVLIPAPCYPGYEPVVKLCGAKVKYIDTSNTNFKLTKKLLEDNIGSSTKCIIIPYPSNPTGQCLNLDELNEIADFIKDKDIFILSDEIYSELVYEERHNSIAALNNLKDKTIVINGLSKSHSMTGFRIGYTLSPSYITKHMIKVHQYLNTCATSISQYAALEALTNGIDDSITMKNEYKKRRDYVYDRLIKMGFDVVRPKGTFYIFPNIKKYSNNSFNFALSLLENEKVAVVPGSAFSQYGEGHIRISFAYSMEELKLGLDRIEKFISTL